MIKLDLVQKLEQNSTIKLSRLINHAQISCDFF